MAAWFLLRQDLDGLIRYSAPRIKASSDQNPPPCSDLATPAPADNLGYSKLDSAEIPLSVSRRLQE